MEEQNNKEIDLIQLSKLIWGSKRFIIKWGIGGIVAGIIIAFSIPKEYQTVIKITPETKSQTMNSSAGALANMVGINLGMSGEGGIGDNLYPEIIKSTPFMMELAYIPVEYHNQTIPLHQYILEHQKRAWWKYILGIPSTVVSWFRPNEDSVKIEHAPRLQKIFVDAMDHKIHMYNDKKTGIYTITTTFQNPKISMIIADSVMSKLQRYMTDYRTCKTKANLESNQKMLDEAQQDYYKADQLYAEALDQNRNLISQSRQIKLDRLKNERDLTFQIYQQLATQVALNKVKLQEETPIATVIEPAITPVVPSSPNKSLLIIAFTFLAAFIASGWIVAKELIKA